MGIHHTQPSLSEYLWIPGYSDKGGCVWCMPISVQFQDGQSISGSWDTLTRGVVCGVHSSQYNPRMVRVSLDLGIVWQVWMCGVYGHPTTVPGLSEYLWSLRILYHSMASLDISRSECPCSL